MRYARRVHKWYRLQWETAAKMFIGGLRTAPTGQFKSIVPHPSEPYAFKNYMQATLFERNHQKGWNVWMSVKSWELPNRFRTR